MRCTAVVAIALASIAAGLVLAAPPAAFAQGCAMCQTALDGPPDPLTQAFNTSSLFLMATPYTVMATFAGWLFLAGRRRKRQADDGAAPELE